MDVLINILKQGPNKKVTIHSSLCGPVSGTDEFDHADYSSVKPTKVAVKVDAGTA